MWKAVVVLLLCLALNRMAVTVVTRGGVSVSLACQRSGDASTAAWGCPLPRAEAASASWAGWGIVYQYLTRSPVELEPSGGDVFWAGWRLCDW